MRRETMLLKAIKIVCGDRNEQYGEPEDNFNKVATYWENYLRDKCVPVGTDIAIQPEDVAMMMVLFKVARTNTAEEQKADTFIDIAGYAACACEIATNYKED